MTFTPAVVQVAPNSTGQMIDGAQVVDGANSVMRQIVVIGDPQGAQSVAGVSPAGNLSVDNVCTADDPDIIQLVGDPYGDFAGVNLLEAMAVGDLQMQTVPGNPGPAPSSRAQAVTIASDQAQDLLVTANSQMWAINQNLFLVDTMAGGPTSYRSFALEMVGQAGVSGGAITIAGSNSGQANSWVILPVYDMNVITGTPIQAAITISATTYRFFTGKTPFRYLRIYASTAFLGGTVGGMVRLSSKDITPQVISVGQPTAANLNATIAGTVQVGNTPNTTPILDTPCPSTSATAALSSLNVNASGALTSLKASAGNLHGFSMLNGTASPVYLSFWNTVVGSVTLGTTAPTMVFLIPASGTLTVTSDIALMNGAAGSCYAAVTAYNGSTPASITGSIFFK